MISREEEKLRIAERKVMRVILGPVQVPSGIRNRARAKYTKYNRQN